MRKKNSSNSAIQTRKGVGRRVGQKIDRVVLDQEMAALSEYLEYLQNRRRLFFTNFVAGVMRGMGFAVGFSILGAVVIMLVQKLALANLPVIGDFFAEIVRFVHLKLY